MRKNTVQLYVMFLLLLGTLSCTPKVMHLASVDERTYRMDERYSTQDDDIESMISPYRENLNKTMDVVIAQNPEEIFKEKPNSPLLNFMADMLLVSSRKVSEDHVDLAVQNYGGIRVSSLPKGNITVGNIYELMPFENTLVILEVPGDDLKKLFDRIADYGGWPISEGTSFTIIDNKYADSIIIDGKAFDTSKTYRLALPDYIANGGDKANYFKNCKRTDTGILIRDLLIEEVKLLGKIPINHEIRIRDEQ